MDGGGEGGVEGGIGGQVDVLMHSSSMYRTERAIETIPAMRRTTVVSMYPVRFSLRGAFFRSFSELKICGGRHHRCICICTVEGQTQDARGAQNRSDGMDDRMRNTHANTHNHTHVLTAALNIDDGLLSVGY